MPQTGRPSTGRPSWRRIGGRSIPGYWDRGFEPRRLRFDSNLAAREPSTDAAALAALAEDPSAYWAAGSVRVGVAPIWSGIRPAPSPTV